MRPRTLSVAAWALGLNLAHGAVKPEQIVTKCPAESQPVRTVDNRVPWACVLAKKKRRQREATECPSGTHVVTTADVYDPFKCAVDGILLRPPRVLCPPGQQAVPTSDPDKEFECRKTEGGFQFGPSCPKGTRPVPTPGELRPFRCFADETPAPTDPTAEPEFPALDKPRARPVVQRCPKGTKKVQTEDPFEPVRCAPVSAAPARLTRYTRYQVPGEVSFDYPSGWHLTDAWTDEVPSVYLLYSVGESGKPLSLTVTRQRHGTPSYKDMEEMIGREKEWHKAEETGRGKVAGFDAVFLGVAKESDTAFVDTGDGYFVISFNAPPEFYDAYVPAYRRAVRSFRIREASRQ